MRGDAAPSAQSRGLRPRAVAVIKEVFTKSRREINEFILAGTGNLARPPCPESNLLFVVPSRGCLKLLVSWGGNRWPTSIKPGAVEPCGGALSGFRPT